MADTSFDLFVLFRSLFAWLFVGLLLSAFWRNLKKGIAQIQRVHQIPCDRCAFCTGDYRLKCTVRPKDAFTEEAINCSDFEPANAYLDYQQPEHLY